MKNFMITVTIIMIMSFSIFTSTSILGRTTRKAEARAALENAMENTLNAMIINPVYDIDSPQEMVAEFVQSLCTQIDSDSALEIKIISVDSKNGLIDVEVTETFKYANGQTGQVSVRKTLITEYRKKA